VTNTHSDIAARRRSTEFHLVLMAGIITAGAYTLASLGQNSVIPPRILPFLAALLLVLMSAHIGVRWLAHGAENKTCLFSASEDSVKAIPKWFHYI
jgi:hypothetical protein